MWGSPGHEGRFEKSSSPGLDSLQLNHRKRVFYDVQFSDMPRRFKNNWLQKSWAFKSDIWWGFLEDAVIQPTVAASASQINRGFANSTWEATSKIISRLQNRFGEWFMTWICISVVLSPFFVKFICFSPIMQEAHEHWNRPGSVDVPGLCCSSQQGPERAELQGIPIPCKWVLFWSCRNLDRELEVGCSGR